jgi:transposase
VAPALTATPGVGGHRPVVGTGGCKGLLDVFVVVDLVTASVHANALEGPEGAERETGQSKARRTQEAFAAHLRHVARTYPADRHERVALVIDNAPWHRGRPIDDARRGHPHLEFERLPSDSPQLNPVERSWEVLRRRATRNRLFDTLADPKTSIRNSLCYFQTVRDRVRTPLNRRSRKQSQSTGS